MANVRVVLTCGNNKTYSRVALESGIGVGVRLPSSVSTPIAFADCHWRNFKFAQWLNAISRVQPETATVPDILSPEDVAATLAIAEAASPYVQRAIIVVPKCDGVIDNLPDRIGNTELWLGYSVPTRYGACNLPIWAFSDKKVHLLGGSPQQQAQLKGYLRVVQVDGNAIISAARHGTYFDGRRWKQTPKRRYRIEELLKRSIEGWVESLR